MPGRRLAFAVVVVFGSFSFLGCSSRVDRGTSGALSGPPAAPKSGPSTPEAGGVHSPSGAQDQVAAAAPAKAPSRPLAISPESFTITADDYGLQLLVGRNNADGTRRDLTSQVAWSVEPAGVARVDQTGYLRPIAEGTVTVRAALEQETAECKVKVGVRGERSWDFAEDIVPVLTRLGCNTGSCHGRADGQNGFHLSLFGYDRDGDFKSLARDGGERRLTRFAPSGEPLPRQGDRTRRARRRPAPGCRLAGIRCALGVGASRGAARARQNPWCGRADDGRARQCAAGRARSLAVARAGPLRRRPPARRHTAGCVQGPR